MSTTVQRVLCLESLWNENNIRANRREILDIRAAATAEIGYCVTYL